MNWPPRLIWNSILPYRLVGKYEWLHVNSFRYTSIIKKKKRAVLEMPSHKQIVIIEPDDNKMNRKRKLDVKVGLFIQHIFIWKRMTIMSENTWVKNKNISHFWCTHFNITYL